MKKSISITNFPKLKFLNRGKVRDLYAVGDHLLLVATDRISAFDVVMRNTIPGKGKILNQMSAFWFQKMEDIIGNHILSTNAAEFPPECAPYFESLDGRSMLVKNATPLPVECIVRGYLAGSGWKDYRHSQSISGIRLPEGLKESCKLPQTLFTPTTKAPEGDHDSPITISEMKDLIGDDLTKRIIEKSLAIYERASEMALQAGIMIADTKMEFGLYHQELILIDELLTPDSSRFWPADEYEEGRTQRSYDKQFLRDYLLAQHWNQKPPAPELPPDIIEKTRSKYEEAFVRLVKY
ncbi:MAG TPA: phosphoribosylaminoimidazolesuccinocarboxamide synthase [Smithellaceae bacterium]|nr:phosphoribosylaminoimidazolesuccinocarboxamide synthase [Smithellaceae bacterium]HQM46304.1 phosphoribosylaminoimidazolesuccinocarboxamide synthase [Smithellaceae bacterium]